MASCGLLTLPANFADFSVLEKVAMPVSNASVDRKGSKGRSIGLGYRLNSSHLTNWSVLRNISDVIEYLP